MQEKLFFLYVFLIYKVQAIVQFSNQIYADDNINKNIY